MKKILFILIFLGTAVCFAESLKTNSDANVRSKPSKDGSIVSVVKKGTIVDGKLSSENSNWYAVTVNGKNGYVNKSLMEQIYTIADVCKNIRFFKDVLFWWIVIDKLILIGVVLFLIFKGNLGKAFLWIGACVLSTFLISLGFSFFSEVGLDFVPTFGYVSLLCVGVSPIILLLLIIFILFCFAAGGTSTKKEKVYKVVEYWVED